MIMSKRLQVLFEDQELRDIRSAARRMRMTVAEWVRQELREARRRQPRASADAKLAAIRAALAHRAPVGDIQRMLAEIERGYQRGPAK